MSKIKFLEVNKNLAGQTQELLNKVISKHAESQEQLKNAKSLESELLGRLRRSKEQAAAKAEEPAPVQEAAPAAEPVKKAEPAAKASEEKAPQAKPAEPAKAEPKAETKTEAKAEVKAEAKIETKQEPTQAVKAEVKIETKPAERMAKTETKTTTEQTVKRSKEDIERAELEAKERALAKAAREAAEKRAQSQAKFAHLVEASNQFQQQQQRERSERQPRQQGDRPRYNNNNRGDQRRDFGDRPQRNAGFMDKDKDYQPRQQGDRPAPKKKDSAFAAAPEGISRPASRRADLSKDKAKNSYDENSKKKKTTFKDKGIIQDDEFRYKKNKKRDKSQPVQTIEPIKIDHAVITGDTITVKLFAEKIGKPVAEIIKKLFMLGMMSTINSEIDFDTASLVAADFDIELEQRVEQTAEDVLIAEDREDSESELIERAPVVTIMGHVDHGKTSLLDAIRETKVTASEAGGITQHIGAYTIEKQGRQITFLDTPGHEAFTAMRLRGAMATDIAVLVVAADDGVMPQTVEAINHAKSANVPIIVAINKIDKMTADPDKIKQKLTEYGLVAEEWGGDTIMVPVSALTHEGIDNLLEMILLQADVLELKANPHRLAKGTIIEAKLDKGRGPVATVLIQNGTLRIQDTIVAGTAYGRVRAMVNDMGQQVKEAGPAMPVEVIGFSEVPAAGDTIYAVEQDKLSRQVAEERKDKIKAEKLKAMSKVSLDDLFNQIAEGQIKDLNLIVKADVQGSVEAVRQSLEKLSNSEVRVRVIHGAVGAISESDVLLASASNAIIIGFNVRPESNVSAASEREGVDIRLYRVIYNAIEDVEAAMKGMLAPEFEEVLLGHAEIRQTYKVSSVGTIAGCYVRDGKVIRNASIRLVRDNIVVHEGKLSSLKRFKDDAKEVNTGYECGLTIENYNDLKEGDIIEVFEMREIAR